VYTLATVTSHLRITSQKTKTTWHIEEQPNVTKQGRGNHVNSYISPVSLIFEILQSQYPITFVFYYLFSSHRTNRLIYVTDYL